MTAKPLTPKERAWLKKLKAVMLECPSDRLACYATGDNALHFYDAGVARKWESENPFKELDAQELHRTAGSALGVVVGSFTIDSCAG